MPFAHFVTGAVGGAWYTRSEYYAEIELQRDAGILSAEHDGATDATASCSEPADTSNDVAARAVTSPVGDGRPQVHHQ